MEDNSGEYTTVVENGIEYSIGDLVKYTVSSVGRIPCEEKAVLIAPINSFKKRDEMSNAECGVAFGHLITDIGDVEIVSDSKLLDLWEKNKSNDSSGVVVRWHTGNNEQCPACSSQGIFANLSGETPDFFKQET